MTGRATWRPVDLAAPEYACPTEPPRTLGLIYRAKRHALSGPPEAAKTLLALIIGLEHARAGHGRFALIDFEAGERATRLMLEDLGASIDEIADVYYVAPDGPPTGEDISALAEAGVTLAIVDAAAGAYAVSELDDNKRSDAETFSRAWIDPLWKRGIATLLLDHVVKRADERGRYAIGSERKLGGVDVHLGVEAIRQLHRGSVGLVRVTTHKDRPAHLRRPHAAEVHFASDPTTSRVTWDVRAPSDTTAEGVSGEWKPTALMGRVSRFLETQPEPASKAAIEANVRGKREYVRQALDFLALDGYVTKTAGRRGAHLYASARRYDQTAPRPDLAPTSPGRGADRLRPTSPDLAPSYKEGEGEEGEVSGHKGDLENHDLAGARSNGIDYGAARLDDLRRHLLDQQPEAPRALVIADPPGDPETT